MTFRTGISKRTAVPTVPSIICMPLSKAPYIPHLTIDLIWYYSHYGITISFCYGLSQPQLYTLLQHPFSLLLLRTFLSALPLSWPPLSHSPPPAVFPSLWLTTYSTFLIAGLFWLRHATPGFRSAPYGLPLTPAPAASCSLLALPSLHLLSVATRAGTAYWSLDSILRGTIEFGCGKAFTQPLCNCSEYAYISTVWSLPFVFGYANLNNLFFTHGTPATFVCYFPPHLCKTTLYPHALLSFASFLSTPAPLSLFLWESPFLTYTVTDLPACYM